MQLIVWPSCFNPRPCGRGDLTGPIWDMIFGMFQSAPLREGRSAAVAAIEHSIAFQSAPLREGRLCKPVSR